MYGFYPYFTPSPFMPYKKPNIIERLLNRKLDFNQILNNTQRTLNVINQAIPIVRQASPLINNARTMFHIMNEFKKVDHEEPKEKTINSTTNSNGPVFFL